MRWIVPGFSAILAVALVLGSETHTGQAAQRLQSGIPGSVLLQPGQFVDFRPTTEPLIGRDVTVENRSPQPAIVSLSAEGILTVSLPTGFRPELSGFLETVPVCDRPAPNVIRCANVFAPAGQFVIVTASPIVTPTPTPTPTPGPPETVPLPTGCTNVALTWPPGTAVSVVANAVQPFGALRSIFRQVPGTVRFVGYSPGVPDFAIDYREVQTSLEPVFICVNFAGSLLRPAP